MPQVRAHAALLLLALLLLTGCQRAPELYQDRLLAFGTLVEISLYGVTPEQGRAASERLQQQFQAQQQAWNPWQPGALAAVNAALAAGGEATIDAQLAQLIERGQALAALSGDRFNPAIGGLIELWGFHLADSALPSAAPEPRAVTQILAQQPRMADLRLEGLKVSSRNPAVQLDFGAFAKGYAVDLALDTLREMGVENALVNAGGDLRTLGRPGARRWRIGIRNPREAGVLASLEVDGGESVFTSGDYERFFEHDGRRYHHILDPATGYPAGGVRSVTVVHQDAMTADAAATALFVAGPQAWPEVARAMGVNDVMLIDEQGRAYMTPTMAERIQLERQPAPPILIRPL
jgi:thiamine biosynthesis lipoprotein